MGFQNWTMARKLTAGFLSLAAIVALVGAFTADRLGRVRVVRAAAATLSSASLQQLMSFFRVHGSEAPAPRPVRLPALPAATTRSSAPPAHVVAARANADAAAGNGHRGAHDDQDFRSF